MERKKNEAGLRFKRVFSDAAVAPFDQIEWERRTAEITDDSGKVIFKQENIEVPKSWSALATKIAVSKYFYGDIANGTDPYKGGRETSVRQLIHRVTRTIADWGIADGYFADKESGGNFLRRTDLALPEPAWRLQLAGLVQRRSVSSIRHRQGRGRGELFLQSRNRPSGARGDRNTSIRRAAPVSSRSVDDTMEDIMRLATSEAMLFKYGSGTGYRSFLAAIDSGKI